MKKIVVLVLLFLFLGGCNDSSTPEIITEGTKEDLLAAIDSYKESMYELGAQPVPSSARMSTIGEAGTIYTKGDILIANLNGHDTEWLDMSILVLNFAEALTNTEYELGEEVLFFDVLEDESLWGWSVFENTKVILSYMGEVMYLRVIDDNLIQTFFFQYVEEDLIKIFRLWESPSPEGNEVYIEDFIEKTGLTMWWSRDESYRTSMTMSDGWTYSIYSSNPGQKAFQSAAGIIDGVPAHVYDEMGKTIVRYDFKFINVFDSFNEAGELFLNEQKVNMPLTMWPFKLVRNSNTVFVLLGLKELSSPSQTLAVEEANIMTIMKLEDVLNNITMMINSPQSNGVSYNYSLGAEAVYNDLSEILYLDY